jgi:hypothetical protein
MRFSRKEEKCRPKWPPGVRFFEIIEVTNGNERTICMIGAASDDARFLSIETYVGEELVEQHRSGLSADLPIAELIRLTEEAAFEDARLAGARCEVFAVDPPFERPQFEALIELRKTAVGKR